MKFISLRTKLIVAFVAFVLLPILGSSIYAYRVFEVTLRNQIESAAADRLNQVNMDLTRKLNTMMNATSSVMLDENVRRLLLEPPRNVREHLDGVQQMDKKFIEISTAIVSNTMYFSLFDNYGNLYTNWGQSAEAYDAITSSDWWQKTSDENGYMVWTLNHPSYARPNQNLITVSMIVRDSSFNQIGVLVISEPTTYYLEILNSSRSSSKSYGLLVGKDGSILGSDSNYAARLYTHIQPALPAFDDTFTTEIEGEKMVVSTYSNPLAEWRFIQFVPHKGIFEPIYKIRNTVSITLAVSMTIFVMIIIFFSSMLTKPLRKLREMMHLVQKGHLDVSSNIRTRDEIGLVGRSFDSMLVKLRNHIDHEIELERHKEQAKLEALQAQINPHFLHNTLNTIRWMSIMAGTKHITEMLVSLGHLLEMSIHRGQEQVLLREELENVQYFLTIQKYRFGDNIKVIEEIAPETLDTTVPKLSLQPLVENVYRHASFQDGQGIMVIRSRKDTQGTLLLEVVDNGLFVNKAKIGEMLEQITKVESNSLSGIGLKNVHKRIQMMFGESFGLHIERREAEGTTHVSLKLPFRNEGDPVANIDR
ncbi:sensor histidine kinase [Paenibacillus thalictri]|uniref:sensor histidine kinase n=1 Tax=Paenibacillus thalictri TaxID=2527873 RepID=UPI0013EF34C1|nr:sensor histidine kinase [Paenibacillus thalictri]